ncbi:hemicentin-2-like [Choristoneura fumiferana]|uniref:hemicentin-2-like n=1 Tax=Choristoneura fumiferana TaxID=7141 RepID=UPI003D15D696
MKCNIILGVYVCLVAVTNGKVSSKRNLDSGAPPMILKEKTIVQGKIGSPVTLTCEVTGEEPIDIYWEYAKSATDVPVPYPAEGPILTISDVEREDAGFYTCLAVNDVDEDNFTMELKIGNDERAPKIAKDQDEVEIDIGDQLELNCELLEGESGATLIRWRFKSKQSRAFRKIENNSLVKNKLIINSVTEGNYGSYQCVARNKKGRDVHIIRVTIKDNANFPPEVYKLIKTVQARKSSSVTIICRIIGGDPPTTVQWEYKKNTGSPDFQTLDADQLTLNIRRVTVHDAGFYKCIAKNRAGSDSHIKELRLMAEPGSAATLRPVIDKTIRKLHYTNGQLAEIPCDILGGDPVTKITLNNKINQVPLIENPLIISDETITYECRAENKAGFDTHIMKITNKGIGTPIRDDAIRVIQAREGQRAMVNCEVINRDSETKIEWWGTGDDKWSELPNGTLFTPYATKYLTSTFSCAGTNSHGSDGFGMEMKMEVLGAPGSPVVLENLQPCTGKKRPPISVKLQLSPFIKDYSKIFYFIGKS